MRILQIKDCLVGVENRKPDKSEHKPKGEAGWFTEIRKGSIFGFLLQKSIGGCWGNNRESKQEVKEIAIRK